MRNLGRLVHRAFLLSSNNGGLLSKPLLTSNKPALGTCIIRRLFSFSSVSNHLSGSTLLSSSARPSQWDHLQAMTGQRRNIFIQTQSTPNPASLMFFPGKPIMENGSADFPNARSAMSSPLAKALFGIDAIMDFFSSGQPLILDSTTIASMDTAIHEDDSETVAMIKELLETRIRPAVQDDGGDIEYVKFEPDTGIVKLRMQGACSGCPSSSVTLKSGIENMLMHYVPEVKGVEQEFDGEEEDIKLTGAPHE